MTITDAVNTSGDLATTAYEALKVYLGASDGSAVDVSSDEQSAYICTRVMQTAGGASMDFAEVHHDLAQAGTRLQNMTVPSGFARQLEVRIPGDGGSRDPIPLLVGDYVQEQARMGGAEQLVAQAQVRPYLFGKPFEFQRQWVHDASVPWVDYEDDVVFNPLIEGQIRGNLSTQKYPTSEQEYNPDAEDYYTWMSGYAGWNSAAADAIQQEPGLWVLAECIHSLCWLLNPTEEFIENPHLEDLTEVMLEGKAPDINNVRMPRGEYLPFYLDRLLQPNGFLWFVDLEYDAGEDKTTRKIKVFAKGKGEEKKLYHNVTASLDLSANNTNEWTVDRTIGDAPNQVVCYGDWHQVEVSIELYKGWAPAFDSLTAEDLDSGGKKDNGDINAYSEGRRTVRRLWVANEGADWTNLRPEITGPTKISADGFIHRIYRRRKILPLLSYSDGYTQTPHPILVEFYDTTEKENEPGVVKGWTKIPDEWGDVRITTDQIGVMFTARRLHSDLMGNERIRLTCTVQSDIRVIGEAFRETYAVNGRANQLTLDVATRFHKRKVAEAGLHRSALWDSPHGADETDDEDACQAYAEKIRDQYTSGDIECSFSLPGWHDYYKIGDLITEIDGREISLDRAAADAPSARYVQVTSREFLMDGGGPRTVLGVSQF